jgi:hypothetical protein
VDDDREENVVNDFWRIEIPCRIYSADESGNRRGNWETGDKIRVTVYASNAREAVDKFQEAVRYAIREIEFT